MGEVLLLMGPPGAGKGTQASKLARARKLCKLSTGDMLRDNIRRETPLGHKAASIMAAGDLVPDELIVAMVRAELSRLDEVRVLLDGFPRTEEQATALDDMLSELDTPLTAVVLLEVDDEELIGRLIKRAEEQQRPDDNEDTIRTRMSVYRSDTRPLLDHYEQKGILRRVNGMGSVEEVFKRISEVLP